MNEPVILIVEDIAHVRMVLAATLEPDYRIIEAATSQEALSQIEITMPDLILLDLLLEGSRMSGMEFCTYIKKQDDLKHIPIIILTGYSTVFDVAEAMAVGAAKYMSKPYSPIDLLDSIARLLGGQSEG